MGYHVYLFRKEVRQNKDLEFLENEDLIVPFTDDQFSRLKTRLLKYGYQIENESGGIIQFRFKDGKSGVQAMLSQRYLSFSSGFSENDVFEISQTASEFTDSGEFAKLDPQDGQWEEWGEV
jgi:hypothetical protein